LGGPGREKMNVSESGVSTLFSYLLRVNWVAKVMRLLLTPVEKSVIRGDPVREGQDAIVEVMGSR
jgi:hypothetical protein